MKEMSGKEIRIGDTMISIIENGNGFGTSVMTVTETGEDYIKANVISYHDRKISDNILIPNEIAAFTYKETEGYYDYPVLTNPKYGTIRLEHPLHTLIR